MTKKKAKKAGRKPAITDEQKTKIASLNVQGWTAKEIAAECDVSLATVARYKAIRLTKKKGGWPKGKKRGPKKPTRASAGKSKWEVSVKFNGVWLASVEDRDLAIELLGRFDG